MIINLLKYLYNKSHSTFLLKFGYKPIANKQQQIILNPIPNGPNLLPDKKVYSQEMIIGQIKAMNKQIKIGRIFLM
jgi:hypothetical protein